MLQETVTLGNDTVIPLARYMDMLGASIALTMDRLRTMPAQINQSRAWHEFGRKSIERWVEAGKIEKIKRGGSIYYDSRQLMALSKNVQDYF